MVAIKWDYSCFYSRWPNSKRNSNFFEFQNIFESKGAPWCFGGPTQLANSAYREDWLWWHTQTRMKMRELTLREEQAIWMPKEKRKSIRAIKKRAWRNQAFGKHQQPTTTWSAEKTAVVDDRQIIKAVKMNPKRRVCKITNKFQKAGVMLGQSTVLRRPWHRITDANRNRQDANLWPAPKIERQD